MNEAVDQANKTVDQVNKETEEKRLRSLTDYSLLKELVPDLQERLDYPWNSQIAEEVRRRAVETREGYRPFHWMRGMM